MYKKFRMKAEPWYTKTVYYLSRDWQFWYRPEFPEEERNVGEYSKVRVDWIIAKLASNNYKWILEEVD